MLDTRAPAGSGLMIVLIYGNWVSCIAAKNGSEQRRFGVQSRCMASSRIEVYSSIQFCVSTRVIRWRTGSTAAVSSRCGSSEGHHPVRTP
jgi:hypothetical protein